MAEAFLGETHNALQRHRTAIAIARGLDTDSVLQRVLGDYTVAHHVDDPNCIVACEEALKLSRRIGAPFYIAAAANNLAALALGEGDIDRAEPLVDECLKHASEIGATGFICGALECRTQIAIMRGDYASAARSHREMSDMWLSFEAGGDVSFLSLSGCLAAALGCHVVAATLWAAAEHAVADLGLPDSLDAVTLRRQWLPRARAATLAEEWDAACEAGRALSLEDAITIARAITAQSPASDPRPQPSRAQIESTVSRS